ncbi:hypothetical protein GGS23DRAFT_472350 [Durotheca rogersii]|uniref:uncharacterized protein n=1 Tax=Durotheca rogersii TaxID=419775 RepID=UPI0022207547|nr:uncharacterized protein GGS23DRAFT_472350 [Durotheca rogersii]KAI5855018.1 hypothetical protein GGS23DRAFT_472350 [Durotheca rogersii]
MRAAQNLRAASRAKAHGLTVDVHSANGVRTVDQNEGSTSSGEASSNSYPSPGPSEALMNPDWRNYRRIRDLSEGSSVGPATAGPDRTEFRLDSLRDKKKLTVDTTLANIYGVRRIKESPVDPDFIHSAPLTNKDYSEVDDDFELVEAEPQYSSSHRMTGALEANARNGLVKLQSFTPTTRQGFEEILGWSSHGRDLKLPSLQEETAGSDQLAQLSPIYAKFNEDFSFPTSRIRAVRSNTKRFTPKEWNAIDEHVKTQLNTLQAPRSARIPSGQLMDDDEQEQAIQTKAFPDDVGARRVHDENHRQGVMIPLKNMESKPGPVEDHDRFQALLDKLHNRRRSQTLTAIKTPSMNNKIEGRDVELPARDLKITSPRSANTVLGVSGGDQLKKSSALNPLASEFCSTSSTSVTYDPLVLVPRTEEFNDMLGLSKSRVDIESARDRAVDAKSKVSADPLRELLAMVEEMKADLAQIKANGSVSQQLSNDTDKRAAQEELLLQMSQVESITDHLKGLPVQSQLASQQPVPSLQFLGQQLPDTAGRNGLLPYLGHLTQTNPVPCGTAQQAHNLGAMPRAPENPADVARPAAVHSPVRYPPGANAALPQLGFTLLPGCQYSQSMTLQGQNRGYSHSPQAQRQASAPFQQAPFRQTPIQQAQIVGPNIQANSELRPGTQPLSMHAQAQNMFGPKPIRKPKSQVNPGDPRATMHQQQYEEYLEMKRAADPTYAHLCKQRQARRVQRQTPAVKGPRAPQHHPSGAGASPQRGPSQKPLRAPPQGPRPQ